MRQAVVVLLLLAAAGCVTAPDEIAPQTATAPALDDPLALLERGEPTANFHLISEWADGNGQEAAAWGDLLFVDVGSEVLFLNVSDLGAPREVGRASVPGASVLDVKVSDDGRFLFTGDDQEASGALGGTGPLVGGFYAIDIEDLASPKVVAYQPIGERRGPHMVFYHRHPDGREILYGASADVTIVEFDRDAASFKLLARYAPDLLFGFNRDPEVFDVLYQGWAHDMFVQTEPDGRVLMYVANWDAGLRIVDVTDPAAPVELGGWNAFPSGHEGNLHTVSTAWVGDRRITVGAVEVGFAVVGGYHYAQGTDASVVYVWDTTDPASIDLLGVWENPMGEKAKRDYIDRTVTSTHNLQLEDGRVYLAHYGLGVWVLDVSTPETQAAPRVLAYHEGEGVNVWDVVLLHGVTYASGAGGVLGLHYAADAIGAAGLTSRA